MPKPSYFLITLLMMHVSLAHAAAGETWEITTQSQMSGMNMPQTTLTICQPKRGEPDPQQMMQDDGNCKISDIKHTDNKITWKVHCDGDGQKMSGSGEMTYNKNSYRGKMRMSGTADGEKMEMSATYRGKRIGIACDTSTAPVVSGKDMEDIKKLKDLFGF